MLVYWSWGSLNISMEYPSLDTAKAGAIRFNTDSSQMEIYDGNQWTGIEATSPELQTGGTRAVLAGGYSPGGVNTMDYFNVDVPGNAIDFGDLTTSQYYGAGFSSRTHGFVAGNHSPSNKIERWVFASTGNATDYSDLSQSRGEAAGMSSSTRGVIAGGLRSDMEYITMSSTATGVDFGNLSHGNSIRYSNGCGNSTRGIIYDGVLSPNTATNVIEYVTISTLGNASDFGDYSVNDGDGPFSCSNATRSVRAGGGFPSGTDTIDFIEIATLGNSTDFGDLIFARYSAEGVASPTRACFAGGANVPSLGYLNNIDYVQFAKKANAVDFGNLTDGRNYLSGATNGHGGL